eukprot:154135-Amphidinium_carterae.1
MQVSSALFALCCAGAGLSLGLALKATIQEGIVGLCARRRQPIHVSDTLHHPCAARKAACSRCRGAHPAHDIGLLKFTC